MFGFMPSNVVICIRYIEVEMVEIWSTYTMFLPTDKKKTV